VSTTLRQAIQAYGIKANFEVIPNAVNTSLFSPPGRKDKKLPWKLLTVALLDPSEKKGIRYLLQAAALLSNTRDVHVDIIGDGPKRQEYERLTVHLDIANKVTFHGLKSKPDVCELMRQADIFVLPSLQENCPCVIIEAMASGLPIVATKVGGIPEIVPPFAGVLIPPKDAHALASALSRVMNQVSEGKHFSPKAISDYAKENFSYEAVGKHLHELYLELINQRTKR
jgi:glycosyltransferase involved in cell wall biosynthesis